MKLVGKFSQVIILALPLLWCQHREKCCLISTNGLLPVWSSPSFVTVPQYLRTKLDLDLEARQRELVEEVRRKGDSLKEEIRQFNEMVSTALDRVGEAKEELEEQRAKAGVSHDCHMTLEWTLSSLTVSCLTKSVGVIQSFHFTAEITQPNASAETKKLVAAYLHGQG